MRKDRIATTIDLILLVLFTLSSVLLCISIYLNVKLAMVTQGLIVIGVVVVWVVLFIWMLSRKVPWVRRGLMLCILIVMIFAFLWIGKIEDENQIKPLETYYRLSLIVEEEKVSQTMNQKKIGVLTSDRNHLSYFKNLNEAFSCSNCEYYEYNNTKQLIHAMEKEKIEGVIVSDYNLNLLKRSDESKKYRVISENTHHMPISHLVEDKTMSEPFVMFISMTHQDAPTNYVSSTDHSAFLFVDPISKSIHIAQLPTNLYVPNIAYSSYPDSFVNVSYNGIDNTLYALKKTFGFEVDYFVKLNNESLLDVLNILQRIDLNQKVCEGKNCKVERKTYHAEEVMNLYEHEGNFAEILEGMFLKKDEVNHTQILNLLNVLKTNSFTNMDLNETRMFFVSLSEDSWSIQLEKMEPLQEISAPSISMNMMEKVSVINQSYIEEMYHLYLGLKHLEDMSNFEFNLDTMRHASLYPKIDVDTVTQENMAWKIDEYYSLFPDSSVNPIEVERWDESIHFEYPNFHPNQQIEPIVNQRGEEE